jgi:hypothetical protein
VTQRKLLPQQRTQVTGRLAEPFRYGRWVLAHAERQEKHRGMGKIGRYLHGRESHRANARILHFPPYQICKEPQQLLL